MSEPYRLFASGYNLAETFSAFTIQETEQWRVLGADRPPNFLVHPSGDINSSIACHLQNPTFYVENPYCQETDNGSNPTIRQINEAGFSSKNCFIFDHICRRERTEDVLFFYSGKIYETHEAFMLSLRDGMGAKVEICWGKHVRERMKKLVNLIPFKLWGKYQDVELFLEIVGNRLLRFIVFVAHPQFFFYHGSFTESGIRFRKTQARKQDLHLAVASKLGGIEIRASFYEAVHRPALYGQFRTESRQVVSQLEAEAEAQLKKAFPEEFRVIESKADMIVPSNWAKPPQFLVSDLIRGDTEIEALRRSDQIANMTQTLLRISGLPSDWDDVAHWNDMPSALIAWIQDQDGLKIDQKPISSQDELMTAFYLLSPTNYQSCDQPLMSAMLKVAVWYISRVKKQRHEDLKDMLIPGAVPYNIMPRKCAECGERVLDDAFACYAKADPKKYVIWYRSNSCGHMACEGGTFLDRKPRWTSETKPKYVIPVRGCKACRKRFSSFVPTDARIETITAAGLSKKWTGLKEGRVDPTKYP